MPEPRPIVTSERVGAVAVLTIDNPPVNALSHAERAGIQAGVNAGCRGSILVRTGKGPGASAPEGEGEGEVGAAYEVADDLAAASDLILGPAPAPGGARDA